MKIAYFGYDFFGAVLRRLVEDGHEISHIFSFSTDDAYNSNRDVLSLARDVSAPVSLERPTRAVMDGLQAAGCDLALMAGYPYKVPSDNDLRILNLHPTLLPQGRGPYPIPWLILRQPRASGLTLHKASHEMDAGDIVSQINIPVGISDSLEVLCAKLQMGSVDFVSQTINQLEELWPMARPQGSNASYWKATEVDWTIDWTGTVEAVIRTVRAFGRLELVAILDGQAWAVTDAEGWQAFHQLEPGKLVHRSGPDLVVAVPDGYVLLKNPRLEVPEQG